MKKAKKYVSIIMILFLIFTSSIVNAANFSCSLKLQPSKNTINPGDTVNINVIVDKITLSDNAPGLTIFDGYLEYDNTVFEDIKKSSINGGDNRTVTYNSDTKRIYVEYDNENGLITTNNTQIFTITMKIKENANIENAKVTLKNITVTDNNQEYKIEAVSIQLGKEGGSITTPSDNNKNNGGNNGSSSSINNNGNNNTSNKSAIKDNTTTSKATLPKTGVAQYGAIAIVVVAIVGVGCYVVYKKISEDIK